MAVDRHTRNKDLIAPLRTAMRDFSSEGVRQAFRAVSTPDSVFRLGHPFGSSVTSDNFYFSAYDKLFKAWPDLERRDWIVVAGADAHGSDWVGCGGYYTGVFAGPFLGIPPTGHQVAMRFHEFYRMVDGKIAEMQGLWDIPEVMMQAGAWPMAPSLGREWQVPGPAAQDGIAAGPHDARKSAATCARVVEMLEHMKRHPAEGGPEAMELERFWHPRMNWYGPAGIGTGRGIAGFRNWHQIPFLNAMPDRGRHSAGLQFHFFGDGDYAAVTGWPNMALTVTGDGWMGIVPSGQAISMRSLDFWRLEGDLIRENWVLVDLLDVYSQLGVDVFARLREFNKARNMEWISIPEGMD